ncbi:hypothetical protein LWI29_018332 [Acer saccharum]|uniref:Uncharacterized protein n=1 Tax=Acer saccharum TaxID=4024 RepID=A0AA39RDD2_ACESA|nr:hypothetical protein LWI29_018332 [Acer saccharum]
MVDSSPSMASSPKHSSLPYLVSKKPCSMVFPKESTSENPPISEISEVLSPSTSGVLLPISSMKGQPLSLPHKVPSAGVISILKSSVPIKCNIESSKGVHLSSLPNNGGASLSSLNTAAISYSLVHPAVIVHHLASSVPSSTSALSSTGTSSTVVGSIPIPLPDVPIVQQVCSLVPREASATPYVIVSSGGPIMDSLSNLLPREVSSPPPVVVSSSGPFLVSLPSGEPSTSMERPFQEHRIYSSWVVQSNSCFIDSQAELGFVVAAPWTNQVDVEVSDLHEMD